MVAASISTFVYAVLFYCLSFRVRYDSLSTSFFWVVIFALASIVESLITAWKCHQGRPRRTWINVMLGMWSGFLVGCFMGDRFWYSHMVSQYHLHDMNSYVNIDPMADRGQSFMDAGAIYFKEDSHVRTANALAFHNGKTYCVAPIVRGTPEERNKTAMDVGSSNTIDFWAVGTDCCGENGDTFSCGDAHSMVARSGMRVLDENYVSMYLLATQEWSASSGLPASNPLFFTWCADPLLRMDAEYGRAVKDYWTNFWVYLVAWIGVAFLVQGFLKGIGVP